MHSIVQEIGNIKANLTILSVRLKFQFAITKNYEFILGIDSKRMFLIYALCMYYYVCNICIMNMWCKGKRPIRYPYK